MTFSDKSAAELVNKNFVCAWKNLQPGFNAHEELDKKFNDAAACRMIPEGHSDKNIVTVFASPDLKVLHVLPGYWQPAKFTEETRFVLELRKEVLDGDLKPRADRKKRFEEMHKEHAKRHDELADKSKGESDPIGDVQRGMGYGRTKSDLQKFLAAAHRDRADHWAQEVGDFEDEFRAAQVGDFLRPKK